VSVANVIALLEAGAAVDVCDQAGCRPLHFAARLPDDGAATMALLRAGASADRFAKGFVIFADHPIVG
jgi:hypothetical protein